MLLDLLIQLCFSVSLYINKAKFNHRRCICLSGGFEMGTVVQPLIWPQNIYFHVAPVTAHLCNNRFHWLCVCARTRVCLCHLCQYLGRSCLVKSWARQNWRYSSSWMMCASGEFIMFNKLSQYFQLSSVLHCEYPARQLLLTAVGVYFVLLA